MPKNLVIVESPAKAKTIEGFLGGDYTVRSSFGHVRDLVKKGLGVNTEGNFEPQYEISEDKKKVIQELRKLCKDSDIIWLATDEDREGEAISWHLMETLDLSESRTRRIVFHEITPTAIKNAIANPRSVDLNLVNAQQARRILDRLVGFELSPVLWKKIKPSLSAGRVQSVAVRLLVDREREIAQFVPDIYYKTQGTFLKDGKTPFKAEFNRRLKTVEDAEALLQHAAQASFFVENLQVTPGKRSPAAPFTTSTLQQEASRKLGFSVSQTMSIAQKLYEAGKITYMRTDSVSLSETALDAAGATIASRFGSAYHQRRVYKTKSKSAQEAHEAIRPTYLDRDSVDGDAREQKLYDLIWKRTLASQMADAQIEKTTITIQMKPIPADGLPSHFTAVGEVIRFEGFLKLYLESTDDEKEEEKDASESNLPAVKIGESLDLRELVSTGKFTYAPARYTEASLVKKLEELGIGRPSTYAPTISTIQKRGYVVKEDRDGIKKSFHVISLRNGAVTKKSETMNYGAERSKLFPTDIGMVVTDYLQQHFDEIMDFNFTALVEKEFDEIAEGNLPWQKMIGSFYRPFHSHVQETLETSDRASGERMLGTHPTDGKPIYARIGRFGPLIQWGDAEEGVKPKYANLKNNQRIESIALEDALKLFEGPVSLGNFESKEMTFGEGRFGPYIKHDGKFFSIPRGVDPTQLDESAAITIIKNKRQKDADSLLRTFTEDPDFRIIKGRWGPFLAVGKNNYKLPKDFDYEAADFETVKAITANVQASPVKAAASARKTAVKTAAKKAPAAKKKSAKKTAPAAKKAGTVKSKTPGKGKSSPTDTRTN